MPIRLANRTQNGDFVVGVCIGSLRLVIFCCWLEQYEEGIKSVGYLCGV